ncbi:AEC family transporter [Luteimonas sp. M1R5S18]|uniref:AEC family transporter n=1 Tax=Luteimonas rhizosphaericola TaxID=3042024 RepID=A0ABT6JJS6_9GAMM|nr:AEC family transporter [Luteimonas rhizosphaericola]MDH5830934.1 AEC family transporter [Luteimonas rhizosphaericola]
MAFAAFALMLAMLALGMAFARLRVLPGNAAETLNRVVLYVCLPAAILIHVPRLRFDLSLLGLVLVPWALAAATWLALRLLAPRLQLRRDEHAVLLLCTMLGNTSFIGYPMVQALLGAQALPYAVVYDQFGTFVMLSTLGLVVLARYGGEHPPTRREIALRIARFPPMWALAFGLTLMPEQPPVWIASALERLAGVLLLLVMLAVGLTIQLRLPRDEIAPLATGLLLKLALLPALSLALALGVGLRGDVLQVAVLESAMPPMITAAALAISHRLAPRLAAALVGYGIVLSLATLPAWTFLLQRLG